MELDNQLIEKLKVLFGFLDYEEADESMEQILNDMRSNDLLEKTLSIEKREKSKRERHCFADIAMYTT